ncbi:MAG: FHA domain-containing protein [Desulfobacterales bacterium]|nr:FHA domain-containing protein [Desulfobacterales bacterium]MDX2511750.1 FHA domain-containing protein [Desulfobacterales bacterium]
MKSEGRAIRKICIFICLAMGLLVVCGWGIFAQEIKEPESFPIPKLPAEMKSDANKPLKVDVLFLLDNSGSMIANDPQFITREVVTKFLMNLKKGFRVGMLIFDREATLIETLSSMDTVADVERFMKSLDRIDYKGLFTNTPSGVERAIYELKSNGREDAEKIIILLTDGIVDTGDKEQDLAGEAWLRDQLSMDCKKAGIRVFGIAFTEMADYRLIQTIALKTEGEYFRTFNSEDIPAVFEKINRIISTPKAEADQSTGGKAEPIQVKPIIIRQSVPSPPRVETINIYNPGPLVLSGLIIIVIIIVFLIYLNKKRDFTRGQTIKNLADALPPQEPPKGQAELIDTENVVTETDLSLPIQKKVVKIGRDESNDIVIPKDSISSLHATIDYRNGYYYLEDHRSTNGTRLNDFKVNENTPMRLKSGDKIQFAIYEFRFLMPEMAPYGETVMIQSNTEPYLKP